MPVSDFMGQIDPATMAAWQGVPGEAWEVQRHLLAHAVVSAWAGGERDKIAPMERHPDSYWEAQFDEIGQFHASLTVTEIRPEQTVSEGGVELNIPDVSDAEFRILGLGRPQHPRGPVFRGASEGLAHRWSWTDNWEVATMFAMGRGEGVPVWVCQKPRKVFGRVDTKQYYQGDPKPLKYTEWVLIPGDMKPIYPAGYGGTPLRDR